MTRSIECGNVVLTGIGAALEEGQTLSYGSRFALSIAVTSMSSSAPSEFLVVHSMESSLTVSCVVDVLAVGGTDSNVHLWLRSEGVVRIHSLFPLFCH